MICLLLEEIGFLGEKELAGFREDHKRRGPARFEINNTKSIDGYFL